MDAPTCSRCPAFLFAISSTASGLCAGCRSGPPEQRIEVSPARARNENDARPWWEQAQDAEGGCPC